MPLGGPRPWAARAARRCSPDAHTRHGSAPTGRAHTRARRRAGTARRGGTGLTPRTVRRAVRQLRCLARSTPLCTSQRATNSSASRAAARATPRSVTIAVTSARESRRTRGWRTGHHGGASGRRRRQSPRRPHGPRPRSRRLRVWRGRSSTSAPRPRTGCRGGARGPPANTSRSCWRRHRSPRCDRRPRRRGRPRRRAIRDAGRTVDDERVRDARAGRAPTR